jgi:hypothetical protein
MDGRGYAAWTEQMQTTYKSLIKNLKEDLDTTNMYFIL